MTRREMIFAAFPLHAQRICECVPKWSIPSLDMPPTPGFTAADVLTGAFYFDNTPEGHDYWMALVNGARA